jgi:hypothetical protein
MRRPVLSKVDAKAPASASSDPGWAALSVDWNLCPVFQSLGIVRKFFRFDGDREDLPETHTPIIPTTEN